MHSSISVIIPAFNEEKNLKPTVDEVLRAIRDHFSEFEIIIIDDGSTDSTCSVANSLAIGNPDIKIVHNSKNRGFGYSYQRGVQMSACDYVIWIPGDNDFPSSSLEALFNKVGQADVIMHYTLNPEHRSIPRRIVSRTYTWLLNLLFGLRLHYFNGVSIHRREIVQAVPISTDGFAFLGEMLVQLIRSGHSYKEVGVRLRGRRYGGSSAFRLRNITGVLRTIMMLFWRMHVSNRKRYV